MEGRSGFVLKPPLLCDLLSMQIKQKEIIMKTKHFLSTIAIVLLAGYSAFAERPLERAEILQLFEKLTSQPRKTWIPAGTIRAMHEEYRAPEITDLGEINSRIKEKVAEYQNRTDKRELTEDLQKMKLDAMPFNVRYELSNEYTMSSTVTVRFDGDRFYWEINVDSRKDSVKPGKDLEDNFMTDQFNLDWNAKRIFAWDGEKYTTYFLPGNHAIVDTTGRTPHVVNGPLTAGIIPWGYGYYSYENLTAINSLAVEKYVDGRTQVHLTLNDPDSSEMLFVMDSAKDYAVLSCIMNGRGNTVISKQYSNYKLVSDNWVPTVILIERYEAGSNRLLASDIWNITSVDANVPEGYNFDVSYENDALIEHFSFVTGKPTMYRHSDIINTDRLLADRVTFAASEGSQTQNCATAALKYAISQLGKNVTDQQLAELITEPNKQTSLYSMKRFVQQLGLYCRAVKTDIQTLKSLNNCEVILHIPGKGHFVVLGNIDDSYVRIIDLAANKFYYRTELNFFSIDWTEGTALIMSNSTIEGKFAEIDESELGSITGSSGYQCNVLRQEYNVIFCDYVGGECGGYYRVFYERWGCGVADSGSCSQSTMIRYRKTPCIEDPGNPAGCKGTGEWTSYYMQACS
jgi:hypothetical protein